MFDERTPLAGCSSPPSYSRPDSQNGSGQEDDMHREGDARRQRMREYYNSVFRSGGVDISVRNVAVVQESVLHHCLSVPRRGRICCQGVSAHFRKGALHLVADVDNVAGAALLRCVSGQTASTSGEIWLDGALAEAPTRVRSVACVGMAAPSALRLTVKDQLSFFVHLHRKERRSWMREVIVAAANFTQLNLRTKVCELSATERFRLQVALELALDPPALFLSYPFEQMDLAQQIESTALLSRLADEVSKTVVVSTRALPMHIFAASDSLLLLGANGLMLYSGASRHVVRYFNQLQIPRHIPEPLWKSVLALTSGSSAAEEDSEVSFSSNVPLLQAMASSYPVRESRGKAGSRLYLAMCTPPRLSSRLFSLDDRSVSSTMLFLLPETTASPPRAPAVEVATSGDVVDLAVEWSESESQTMYYAAKFYDSSSHARLLALVESRIGDPSPSSPTALTQNLRSHPPSSVWRFFLLLRYSLKQALLDPEVLVGAAFLSVGLTVLAGLAQSQPENQGGMYNTRGLVFMAFVLVLFTNLATMDDARAQLRTELVHRKRHLYGTVSFVTCLSLRIMLLRSLYLALFFPFVIFALQSCYTLVLLVWLVSCAHAAFQYLAASLLPSMWWTRWMWYACFGFNVMFSGFLLNLRTIPGVLGKLSYLRWGYGAVLHVWLEGKGFQCDGAGNTSYCYTGDDYLAIQGLAKDSVVTSSIVLSACGVAMMVVLAVVLRLRSL